MESKVSVQRNNSKMGKVWHVSLPPIISCAKSAPCAAVGCYAMKAWVRYPNCRSAWTSNLSLWQHSPAEFERSLRLSFSKAKTLPPLFRWHMAGDIPDFDYLDMMIRIAETFKQVKFLAFTKKYELIALLDRSLPENLSIVLSAWPGYPLHNPKGLPVAYMQDGTETRIPEGTPVCSGKCDSCILCWGSREEFN